MPMKYSDPDCSNVLGVDPEIATVPNVRPSTSEGVKDINDLDVPSPQMESNHPGSQDELVNPGKRLLSYIPDDTWLQTKPAKKSSSRTVAEELSTDQAALRKDSYPDTMRQQIRFLVRFQNRVKPGVLDEKSDE